MNFNSRERIIMESRGQRINGSRYYRAFCIGCGDPVRVTKYKNYLKTSIFCEECNPKHSGCTGPESPIDRDAYGISTQTECHIFV